MAHGAWGSEVRVLGSWFLVLGYEFNAAILSWPQTSFVPIRFAIGTTAVKKGTRLRGHGKDIVNSRRRPDLEES
jgi:hypothetical protein